MSEWLVEFLRRSISESNARSLVDAGLLDAGLFQFRRPIDQDVATLLADLPSLRRIQFGRDRPDGRSLDLLNDLVFSRRKDLLLRVYSTSDFWADIGFLQYLPDVELFDWDVDVFGSVEPLRFVKKLTHLGLGLSQPKPKLDLHFLLDLPNPLESLSIAGDYKNAERVIPELRKLRSAWFVSTKLPGFELLSDLPIETLGNYGGRVESFESVRGLKSLRRVWIKTNAKIENLKFIEYLPNLERIELLYLSKITRFPKCDHLKKLKLIFAFECNRLSDIRELHRLSGVKVSVSGKAIQNRLYKTDDFSMGEALNVSGRWL